MCLLQETLVLSFVIAWTFLTKSKLYLLWASWGRAGYKTQKQTNKQTLIFIFTTLLPVAPLSYLTCFSDLFNISGDTSKSIHLKCLSSHLLDDAFLWLKRHSRLYFIFSNVYINMHFSVADLSSSETNSLCSCHPQILFSKDVSVSQTETGLTLPCNFSHTNKVLCRVQKTFKVCLSNQQLSDSLCKYRESCQIDSKEALCIIKTSQDTAKRCYAFEFSGTFHQVNC